MHKITDIAVEDPAQIVKGFRGDIHIVFEAVQCTVGHVVFACQRVPVFLRIFQRFPKGGIVDQSFAPPIRLTS